MWLAIFPGPLVGFDHHTFSGYKLLELVGSGADGGAGILALALSSDDTGPGLAHHDRPICIPTLKKHTDGVLVHHLGRSDWTQFRDNLGARIRVSHAIEESRHIGGSEFPAIMEFDILTELEGPDTGIVVRFPGDRKFWVNAHIWL